MANIQYQGMGDNAYAFGKYDVDSATQTRLADCPVALSGNSQLAYDGYYVYAVGVEPGSGNVKIARYNPGGDTWAIKAGGAAIPNSGTAVCVCCNGATVFTFSGGNIYGYNIASDTNSLLTVTGKGTNNPLMCWDYADTLYLCSSNWNNGYVKYTISTNSFALRGFSFTVYRNNAAVDALFYTNGHLYQGIACFDDNNYYLGQMTDNGSTFTMASDDSTHMIGTATSTSGGGSLVSPSVYARSSGSTIQLCDLNSYHAAATSLSHTFGGSHGGTCFTIALNTTFAFYEGDGITVAPLTDNLGGGKAVASNAFAGPYAYQIAAASPRTTVTVSVIAQANQPMSATAALAAASTGPFSVSGAPVQSIQIGPMSAGQKKTIYIGNFVPLGATPGQYAFSIQVTGT